MGPERVAPLEMSPEEFRRLGHRLVDRIASFLAGIRTDPLTPGETPAQLRPWSGAPAPQEEAPAEPLVEAAASWSSPFAPQRPSSLHGIHHLVRRADRRAGGPARLRGQSQRRRWELSPVATEIEAQTIRWIAELVGYPPDAAGSW